jgi:hypothetical protein
MADFGQPSLNPNRSRSFDNQPAASWHPKAIVGSIQGNLRKSRKLQGAGSGTASAPEATAERGHVAVDCGQGLTGRPQGSAPATPLRIRHVKTAHGQRGHSLSR